MSFLTATNTELIYNMEGTGADYALATAKTTLTPSTTSGVLPAYLPPLWSIWQPSTISGKGFRVVLAGTYDTGAVLGMTLAYGTNTTQAATSFGGGFQIAATGSTSLPASTAGSWYATFDIIFTGAPTSAGSVVQGYVNGFMVAGAGNNAGTSATATGNVTMIGGTTSSGNGVGAYSFTAWNAATAYFFDLNGVWSSATNSTHFCLQEHQIYGLN